MDKSFFFTHEGQQYELTVNFFESKLIGSTARLSVSDVSLKHLSKPEEFRSNPCVVEEVRLLRESVQRIESRLAAEDKRIQRTIQLMDRLDLGSGPREASNPK